MALIQIGSGSANYDTFTQDGFSNFILKKNFNKKIYIVEANSLHIKKLKQFWKSKKNVQIFNKAIIPDNIFKKKMVFFYSLKDKPNFQIFSNSKNFVKRHFPNSVIKKKKVNCIRISEFLENNRIKKIDYLSIDIEGMDFDVLINLDLSKFKFKNISFEHLHLSFVQRIRIVSKFFKNDYYFTGMGFDIKKSDWMFSKGANKNIIKTILLPLTPRRIWKKYSFSNQI